MPTEENMAHALMKVGLTEYESRIYVALVQYGPKRAGEISFISKVPRPKTYGALRELIRKNLVEVIPEKPERYMAASPNEKLVPLVNRLMDDTQHLLDIVQSLSLTYESLKYVYRDKSPEKSTLFSVFGRKNTIQMLNTLFENARQMIRIVTSEKGLVRYYKFYSSLIEESRSRGIKIYMLTTISQENQKIARELKDLIDIKSIEEILPINYILIDSDEMFTIECFPDDYDNKTGKDVAVHTKNPVLIKMFEFFFSLLWEKEKRKNLKY